MKMSIITTGALALLFASATTFAGVDKGHYSVYFNRDIVMPERGDNLHALSNAQSVAALAGYEDDLRVYCGAIRAHPKSHWEWLKSSPARLFKKEENSAIWNGVSGTFGLSSAMRATAAVGLFGRATTDNDLDFTEATPTNLMRSWCYDKFPVVHYDRWDNHLYPDDSANARINSARWLTYLNKYREFWGIALLTTNLTAWAGREWNPQDYLTTDEWQYLAQGTPTTRTTPYYSGYWDIAHHGARYGVWAHDGHNPISVKRGAYSYTRYMTVPAYKDTEVVEGGLVKVVVHFEDGAEETVERESFVTNTYTGTISLSRGVTGRNYNTQVGIDAVYDFSEAPFSLAGVHTNGYIYCQNSWLLPSADRVNVPASKRLYCGYTAERSRIVASTMDAPSGFNYPVSWFEWQSMTEIPSGTDTIRCYAKTALATNGVSRTIKRKTKWRGTVDPVPQLTIKTALDGAIGALADINEATFLPVYYCPYLTASTGREYTFEPAVLGDYTVYDDDGVKAGYAAGLDALPEQYEHATTNIISVTAFAVDIVWDGADECEPVTATTDIWMSGAKQLNSDF